MCSRRPSPPPTSLRLGRRREAGSGNDHEGEARGGTSAVGARWESRDSTRASRAADCEETIEAYILKQFLSRFLQRTARRNDFHRRFLKPVANVN
jgi:hypothetical protein